MLTSRETPRDSLRNMDHVYFFRLVEFSHPQNCLQKKSHVDMATFSCANKKKLCFTQSQGFHFFLARHSSSLICIRVPTNNLSWWSSGHLTPNAKKTTWMFGAKNRSLRSRCRTCDSTNTHIISHEYRQAGDVEQQKSRRFWHKLLPLSYATVGL